MSHCGLFLPGNLVERALRATPRIEYLEERGGLLSPPRTAAMKLAARRPLALFAALSTALLACGPEGGEDPYGTAQEEIVVCPGPTTLEGIDVSYYQPNVDWNAVKASGREFAVARINDGTFMDPDFDKNWAGMKAAGLIRGAYQFFRPGQDAAVQADVVIQKVGFLGPGDLPVTLDMEATDGQ